MGNSIPSLINELLPGLKLDGKFTLNPFKRVENEALGGKQILGAAKGAGALAIGAAGAAVGHGIYLNQHRKKLIDAQNKYDNNMTKIRRETAKARLEQSTMKANQIMANHYAQLAQNSTGVQKQQYESMRDSYQDRANQNKLKYGEARAAAKKAGAEVRVNRQAIKDLKDNRLYQHKVISTAGTVAKGAYFGARWKQS